jgi:prephenate dehydratase
MESFPAPALALVEELSAAAAADPSRAIAFQGAPGANSHRAALEYAPGSLPLPCFAFEDALEAVKSGRAGAAIIPIENSQHGRVADIHFLLPESGLSIVGEHFLPIRPTPPARQLTSRSWAIPRSPRSPRPSPPSSTA